jgi:glycosidase
MKNVISIIILAFIFFSCQDQKENDDTATTTEPTKEIEMSNDINRIEPPHWWVGFQDTSLQLLVHHDNIGAAKVSLNYNGVTLKEQHQADSPNYLFLDLEISNAAQEGKFNIHFKFENGEELIQTYELRGREKASEDYVGFDSSDVIYLITPDRFANANPENDSVESLLETKVDRSDDFARHGGDIQGIAKHLDYIEDMGFTAIWSSPLLTNDMRESSYHGYAITDYYQIDPRFGTNEEYKALVNQASKKGIKVIMDQVANHCGLEHWWMKDLPFSDWVNYQDYYESNIDNWNNETVKTSNHRRTSNQDNYASESDKQGMTDGWFVSTMPDLNQRNPFMAKYIIQNSIWSIEEFNLGGIRQDTYPYPDKAFMSDWAGAIMKEYPNFNIVGEEWSYNPLLIAYWQEGNNNKDGYDSNLKSTMDFAMQQNIIDALNEEEAWDKGLVKIYEGLANDFIYPSPKDILVFPDNHDMSRVHTQLKGDIAKTKMALSFILAMPRTVQIYYGTEILMDDFRDPGNHGVVRTDFPGGWQGDPVNAFTGEGLNGDQKNMQEYLKALLNYRKTSKAIHEGKTIHFAPKNGIYVLFRTFEDEIVAVIINKSDESILDTTRFEEINLSGKTLKNVVTGEQLKWNASIGIQPNGVTFLSTKI